MTDINFRPWVGAEYHKKNIFNSKILIVGESHYCGGCREKCILEPHSECENFTTNTIQDYIEYRKGLKEFDYNPTWTKTYLKFERSLVGHETNPHESEWIWNSVAFMNFLQIALDAARRPGEIEDYFKGQKAFIEVLDTINPDLIIVWGVSRMYDYMPEERWTEGVPCVFDNYSIKHGWYESSNGHKARTIWIYHPSTGYTWDWWHKAIRSIMD